MHIPDRTIESGNSEDIPFARDPAPKSGVSIHMSPFLGSHEKVGQSRDEGQAVAAQEIVLFQTPKLICPKFIVEGQENVQSHSKGPVSISWHEPGRSQLSGFRSSRNYLHLNQEGLELAEGTVVMLCLDCCSGHDGCNVCEYIAHGSVEDETVDWLVEGLGKEEGNGNEGTSCQGQD